VDEILDVQDPDITFPEAFADSAALPAIRAGVIGDFAVAYDAQVLYSGLLGDEWIHSGTFPTRSEVDIRTINFDNATLEGVTRSLYRARAAAEAASGSFQQFSANSAAQAEMINIAGLTFLLFAENYCSGVPFSTLNADGTFEFGGQETTQQILQRALDRGTSALAAAEAAGSLSQTNLARIVRGRALLNMGRYSDAAAAVADVPSSFEYVMQHSDNTGREENDVYGFNVIVERWSVANQEGMNGLPYRENFTNGDPRTPWRRSPPNDVGFDRATPQYDNQKYDSRSASTVVTNGFEARLIQAEAALQSGDGEGFIGFINEIRDFFGLDEIDDPGSREARVDLLFQERAYTLWLTSHRLGDMRRLIRPTGSSLSAYGRAEDNVFPIGQYHKNVQGGVYGNDVNLPISIVERNNPEFAAFPVGDLCLDRNP
jgi:hypothetical protein